MSNKQQNIYDESAGSHDTLANLGPLNAIAGTWVGEKGGDNHPVAEGAENSIYVEHYDLQPIDRQTNGPQLFYGLRYHKHITKPGEVETFHDQVGYWLWEPATKKIYFTLAIPRGETLMAFGTVTNVQRKFTISAEEGSDVNGIISNPFLYENFRTTKFSMTVTVNKDGTWSYAQQTTLLIKDRPKPYIHLDQNTLTMVKPPTPNPLSRTF